MRLKILVITSKQSLLGKEHISTLHDTANVILQYRHCPLQEDSSNLIDNARKPDNAAPTTVFLTVYSRKDNLSTRQRASSCAGGWLEPLSAR